MNTSIPILFLTISTISCAPASEPSNQNSPAADQSPTLPRASVEMPWSEFETLWHKANTLDQPEPLLPGHAVVESRFILDWKTGPTKISATWTMENFAAEPRWVKVLPADAMLAPARGNSSPPSILRQTEGISFLLPQTGRFVFEATLLGTSEGGPEGREVVRFPVGWPGIAVLEIRNLPDGFEVQIPGAIALKNENSIPTFVLSSTTTEATIVVKNSAEQRQTLWEWQAETVMEPETSRLKYSVRVSASLLSGGGRILRLPLPQGIRAPLLKAPGVESWNFVDSDPAEIEITWRDDTIPTREFFLEYEQPLAFGTTEWTLLTPLRNQNQSPTVVAILAPANIEVTGEGLRENGSAFPASTWLRSHLENKEFIVLESSGLRTLGLHYLPLAEPANLAISKLLASTRIVKDGAVLTEIEAQVRANAPARWTLNLPADAQLLRCSADGEAIRPVQRGDALEIALPSSKDGRAIKIELSYTAKMEALDPVAGGVVLLLPKTGEFIDLVEWHLNLPAEYAVAGMESAAEILPAEPGQPLRLRQQLVRGSQVQVGLFYRKRGLD